MSDDKMREAFEAWAESADFVLGRPANDVYDSDETEAAWQGWKAAHNQGSEPVSYWVLYDSEASRKYIKKAADGCLAFFDNEDDARRMKRRHRGVNYKRVDYYTAPQPQT